MRPQRAAACAAGAVVAFLMVTVVAFAGAQDGAGACDRDTPAVGSRAGGAPENDNQVAAWARQAGWPEHLLAEVVATTWAESSHNPGVVNGLLQIGPSDAARWEMPGADVNDPVVNLQIGLRIYEGSGGWGAYWGVWPGPGRPVPQNNKVQEKLSQLRTRGWSVGVEPEAQVAVGCAQAAVGALGPSVNGVNPEFLRRFHAYNAECWGGVLTITDGFRSQAQQADLFRRKPDLAAPPGRSNHERGLAIDHSHAEQNTEAHRHCAIKNHLFYPMSPGCSSKVEKWHIEPI